MDKLKPYFPINNTVRTGNILSLIIAIVIYVVVAAVLGVLLGVLAHIPIVSLIVRIVSTLVWIYEVVGIVLAIYTFLK